MGAKSGVALKFLQWFLRGVQFLCAALILGVYSYFLASLHNHNIAISRDVKAVEGIAGAGVLYTAVALLLLCCLAGIKPLSFIACILDVAFIGAFVYVAVANKHGASSCQGYLDTPFGQGQSGDQANVSDGFTALPSFYTACRLQSACLAVAIIAIVFFIFSILTEVALARHHHKEKRFGPSPQNNYTSGYGKDDVDGVGAGAATTKRRGGFFSRLFGRKRAGVVSNENALPMHTTPNELNHQDGRQSYGTETTAVPGTHHHQADGVVDNNPYAQDTYAHNTAAGYNTTKYDNTAYGHPTPSHPAQQTGYAGTQTTDNHRYGDGVYDRV